MRHHALERMVVGQRRAGYPVLQLLNLLGEHIVYVLRIRVQRVRGELIRTRRAPHAEIDAARRNRLQHAKLLRHLERRVMRQHHAGAADADARRGGGNRRHQHLRRGADDIAGVVMLGKPIAVVTERVAMFRERQRFAYRDVLCFAFGGGGLIEYGQLHGAPAFVGCGCVLSITKSPVDCALKRQ